MELLETPHAMTCVTPRTKSIIFFLWYQISCHHLGVTVLFDKEAWFKDGVEEERRERGE